MFGTRWRLFRLLGIPISLDLSWFLILFLVTISLESQFRQDLHGLSYYDYWMMGLVTALAFFICIVLHELGHATVARARGIHIRSITLFLFGGVAELGDEPTSAGTEFVMAIAGPVVSAILGGIFWVASNVVEPHSPPVALVLHWLAYINLTVLIFNLIPAFPLDGGRVFRSILWGVTGNVRRATHWASILGQAFAWFLILVGVWQIFFHTSENRNAWINGLWLAVIGLFLNNAAKTSYQQIVMRQALAGEPIRRFMNPQPIIVPPTLDLRHWVEEYVYRYHRKTFPVASDGHLEGFINTQALSRIPREEWDQHTVAEVMRPDIKAISIGPDADAFRALAKMQHTGSSRLLVTDGDQLLGIVSLKDLLRFLQLKLELQDHESDGDHSAGHYEPAPREPKEPAS
jgi:Zn-dependent protease/CBS domain-containing protein